MITFLKAAFHNLRQTGSLIESSRHLSRRMTRIINFRKPVRIVELGAGTGSITKHILNQMNSKSSLTSFEINPALFAKLQQVHDNRFTGINDNVLLLPQYVKEQTADYIISGLPLANIGNQQKEAMLQCCLRALKPGGYYIQFQYSLRDIKLLKKQFPSVSCGFTLLNFPPAFVYYAKK